MICFFGTAAPLGRDGAVAMSVGVGLNGLLTQLPALAVANSSWFNTQAFFVYGCACQSLSALALAVLLHGRWQHGRGQHDPRLLRSERSCAHLGTEPAGSSGQCAEPCTQPAGHERAGDDGDPSSEQAADRAGHSRRHWQRRVPGRGRAPTPRGCMRLAIGPSRPPSYRARYSSQCPA